MKKCAWGGLLLCVLISMGCGSSSGPSQSIEPAETYPDLAISALAITDRTENTIDFSCTLTNWGNAAVNLDGPTDEDSDNVCVQAFLSDDMVLDDMDVDLGIGETDMGGELAPEVPVTVTGTVTTDSTVDSESTPYLILVVDSDGLINESDEENNFFSVEIPSLIMPDLVITELSVTSITEESLIFSYMIENAGAGPVNGSIEVQAVLSYDDRLTANDALVWNAILDFTEVGLAPDEIHEETIDLEGLAVDDIDKINFLIMAVDVTDVVVESDETNNTQGAAATGADRPDLQVTDLEVTVWTPESIDCTYTVTNKGRAAVDLTGSPVEVQAYLSVDENLDTDEDIALDPVVLGPSAPPSIGIDEMFPGSFSISIPDSVDDVETTPFLILVVDPGNAIAESRESNNISHAAPLGAEGFIDLEVTSFTVVAGVSDSLDISYTIVNNGNMPMPDGVTMSVYFSEDNELGDEDKTGGTYPLADLLPNTKTLNGPIERDLYEHVILVVDADNDVAESNEDNNSQSAEIPLRAMPDLEVTVDVIRNTIFGIRYTYTVTNSGGDFVDLDDNLTVQLITSGDDIFGNDDDKVIETIVAESPLGVLAPGESWYSDRITTRPQVDTPYLFIRVDPDDIFDEDDEDNNVYGVELP